MKYSVLHWGMFICLLGLGVQACHVPDAPPPNEIGNPLLIVSKTVFTCPDSVQGQQVRSEPIIIQNAGKKPLIVESVTTGCLCTVADATFPFTIHPNEERSMLIQVDTSKLAGDFKTQVVITSNASNSPLTELSIVGKVEALLLASPARLGEQNIVDDNGKSILSLTIITHGKARSSDLKLLHVPEQLRLVSRLEDSAAGASNLTFEISSLERPLVVDNHLTLSCPAYGRDVDLSIPVAFRLFSDLKVDPYPINVGTFRVDSHAKLNVRLKSKGAIENFHVISKPEEISQIDVSPDGQSGLILHLTAFRTQSGPWAGQIMARFKDGAGIETELVLPVSGLAL